MRISMKDTAYRVAGTLDARHTQPYLNGEKVTHCVEADDQEGYVLTYSTNESGRIEAPLILTFHFGKVEIKDARAEA